MGGGTRCGSTEEVTDGPHAPSAAQREAARVAWRRAELDDFASPWGTSTHCGPAPGCRTVPATGAPRPVVEGGNGDWAGRRRGHRHVRPPRVPPDARGVARLQRRCHHHHGDAERMQRSVRNTSTSTSFQVTPAAPTDAARRGMSLQRCRTAEKAIPLLGQLRRPSLRPLTPPTAAGRCHAKVLEQLHSTPGTAPAMVAESRTSPRRALIPREARSDEHAMERRFGSFDGRHPLSCGAASCMLVPAPLV